MIGTIFIRVFVYRWSFVEAEVYYVHIGNSDATEVMFVFSNSEIQLANCMFGHRVLVNRGYRIV